MPDPDRLPPHQAHLGTLPLSGGFSVAQLREIADQAIWASDARRRKRRTEVVRSVCRGCTVCFTQSVLCRPDRLSRAIGSKGKHEPMISIEAVTRRAQVASWQDDQLPELKDSRIRIHGPDPMRVLPSRSVTAETKVNRFGEPVCVLPLHT